MEEFRSFHITLISASDLQSVRKFNQMKVYAKVSISGNTQSESATPVDKERQTNPRWNFKIEYSIREEEIQCEEDGNLAIKFFCQRSLKPDKYVGEVNLSLKKLFDDGLACKNVEYDVYRSGDEGTFGKLKLSYWFSESTEKRNVNQVGGSSSSTTGQKPAKAAAILLAASVIADALQIGDGIKKGLDYLQDVFSY